MYKNIAIEDTVFAQITNLARATNRTNGGMVKELLSEYLKNVPVIGKIEDGKVILRDDYALDKYQGDCSAS